MFLIIWHHLCRHGIFFAPNVAMDFNTIIGKGFLIWSGNLGNYLFIFVSGYFISNSIFNYKKMFKLWLQIFSTSAIIGLILYVFKIQLVTADVDFFGFYNSIDKIGILGRAFTSRDLIKSFLPTLLGNNWFASSYLVFFMFTPFLNESLKFLDRKKFRNLIILLTFWGTIVCMFPGQGIFQKNNLFYFIHGYYIANYIRIYDPIFLKNQKRNLGLVLAISSIFVVWIVLVLKYRDVFPFINSHFGDVFCYPFALAKFPALLNAVFLFAFFKNLRIRYSKLINLVAGTTFGVYLIHENLFFNKILWHRIFKMDDFLASNLLLPYMIFAVISTFVVCSIIDLIRKKIIEQPILALVDKKLKQP
ncbi:Acyltransferase family protein [Fibrobacter sp. UWB15]|nr:acyltransferase-like protein [Fibrobacter sp. UWB6]SHF98143.1 Acyltransferase family protein [Fibrobacter sp. UWB8]SMG23624.1 Acyltransferase family protein [Fibrobacter sp. UWB15]